MTWSDWVLVYLGAALLANGIVLLRHWRLLKAMEYTINSMMDVNRQFSDLMEQQRNERAGNG
jgi:hypothetical protein